MTGDPRIAESICPISTFTMVKRKCECQNKNKNKIWNLVSQILYLGDAFGTAQPQDGSKIESRDHDCSTEFVATPILAESIYQPFSARLDDGRLTVETKYFFSLRSKFKNQRSRLSLISAPGTWSASSPTASASTGPWRRTWTWLLLLPCPRTSREAPPSPWRGGRSSTPWAEQGFLFLVPKTQPGFSWGCGQW